MANNDATACLPSPMEVTCPPNSQLLPDNTCECNLGFEADEKGESCVVSPTEAEGKGRGRRRRGGTGVEGGGKKEGERNVEGRGRREEGGEGGREREEGEVEGRGRRGR